MGTPVFTVPVLEALIGSGHDVVCVYTQPPRPKGRGNRIQRTAIHECADRHGIEVRTPVSLKKDAAARTAFLQTGLDAAVVAGYGMMLPQEILDGPRFGCLNIHPSLLPRWRGTSPVQHSIWKGDSKTGVTIIRLVEKMDAGPMIAQKKISVGEKATAADLDGILWPMGAAMLTDALDRLARGEELALAVQNEQEATYAPLLTKEDGRIDWARSAAEIDRQVRALNPWPGVWTLNGEGKRIKILAAEIPVSPPSSAARGEGIFLDRTGHVSCGGGSALRLVTVQPENAKALDMAAAVNGGYLKVNDIFQ